MGKKDAVEKLTIEKVRYILGLHDDLCILLPLVGPQTFNRPERVVKRLQLLTTPGGV